MTAIPLRDVLIHARQESFRMRHFYLGVEHLFIALLEIQGGLTANILEDHGLTPDYVIDAVRRKSGKGGKHRLWAGIPNTPRCDIVLGIANDLALEQGRTDIDERDLLRAILEEGESMPVRVVTRLGLDAEAFAQEARTRTIHDARTPSYLKVAFGAEFDTDDALEDDALFILRRMFHGYDQIRVERRLSGGHTGALILLITPIHADSREDAAVVVKIDKADTILDEARRYEAHVKNTLPPLTARVEDKPTAPETSELAGIRYTFVSSDGAPRDLGSAARLWRASELGAWLKSELYPTFGKTWWMQRRPFQFQVWTEYDALLPSILTLEWVEGDELPPNSVVIKDPIKRSRVQQLEYGDLVVIENFTVQKVMPDRGEIRLAIGRGTEAARRAYAIDVRGINLSETMFYRGEAVERLIGRVYKTRQDTLKHAASALEPTFDLRAETIPGVASIERLPNPILAYDALLDRTIRGSFSRIHGDLHLGNILVGPNDTPFLIDFAQAREGHPDGLGAAGSEPAQ